MPSNDNEPVTLFTGETGKTLTDQITLEGRPYNINASNVRFIMRARDTDTQVVNAAASFVTNGSDGRVKYSWAPSDIATQGEYYAWWRVVLSGGGIIETNEFLVIVDTHSPGDRTRTGAIYRAAKGIIPITWTRLQNLAEYGDSQLQDQIENCKLRVFNSVILPQDEKNLDRRVVDYVGKLVVLYVIPAGMDYWLSQKQSISATGTNENVSYPDRIKALELIYERLLREVASERSEIEAILGVSISINNNNFPIFSAGAEEGFITPLPSEHMFDYNFNEDFKGQGRSRSSFWNW